MSFLFNSLFKTNTHHVSSCSILCKLKKYQALVNGKGKPLFQTVTSSVTEKHFSGWICIHWRSRTRLFWFWLCLSVATLSSYFLEFILPKSIFAGSAWNFALSYFQNILIYFYVQPRFLALPLQVVNVLRRMNSW